MYILELITYVKILQISKISFFINVHCKIIFVDAQTHTYTYIRKKFSNGFMLEEQ